MQDSTVSRDATLIGVLGVVLIVLVLNGQLTNYVQGYFKPIMILVGLALVSLAVWTLVAASKGTIHVEEDSHRTAWMLVIPLALVIFFAPQPLGAALLTSNAVGGAPQAGQAPNVDGRVPRNPDGTIAYPELHDGYEVTLEELSDRFYFGVKSDLEGKEVKIVGFAAPDESENWLLARFKIYCCAADAIPYSVVVADMPEPRSDAWFEITGTLKTDGDRLTISATSVDPISQPANPYI